MFNGFFIKRLCPPRFNFFFSSSGPPRGDAPGHASPPGISIRELFDSRREYKGGSVGLGSGFAPPRCSWVSGGFRLSTFARGSSSEVGRLIKSVCRIWLVGRLRTRCIKYYPGVFLAFALSHLRMC